MSENTYFRPFIYSSVVLATVCFGTLRAAPRETLSLDGVWSFATDPDGVGDRE